MDVPDWLLKPTKNNRQHITIMSLIEHVQKAAERRGIDPFLEKQIDKLEKVHLQHAKETSDLDDGVMGEVREAVLHNKRKAIIIGLLLTLSIWGPYLAVTRTSWFIQKPILCKVFPTEDYRHPGQIEICINGVTREYSPKNGDVELDFTFMETATSRVQADITFWIADKLGYKDVNYMGEYNTSRTRVYENGIMVSDDHDKVSSWVDPIFPLDVRESVWHWVKDNKMHYNRDRPPLEEKLSETVSKAGAVIATLASIGLTIYRFLRANG